jgi:outer membrane protein OmpA-like peptidoglycan-associated protein
LRPKLERMARAILRVLRDNPDAVFLIEGHTDAVGSEEDNLSLSDRRAQAVAEILTETFEVPPENLVTQGYGEQFLKVDTQGPEPRNRRVTIRNITRLMAER